MEQGIDFVLPAHGNIGQPDPGHHAPFSELIRVRAIRLGIFRVMVLSFLSGLPGNLLSQRAGPRLPEPYPRIPHSIFIDAVREDGGHQAFGSRPGSVSSAEQVLQVMVFVFRQVPGQTGRFRCRRIFSSRRRSTGGSVFPVRTVRRSGQSVPPFPRCRRIRLFRNGGQHFLPPFFLRHQFVPGHRRILADPVQLIQVEHHFSFSASACSFRSSSTAWCTRRVSHL